MTFGSQSLLFPELTAPMPVCDSSSSTFTDNMRLPVHRWIRFSAGFSGAWAQYVIAGAAAKYLDSRQEEWFALPTDIGITYLLARPELPQTPALSRRVYRRPGGSHRRRRTFAHTLGTNPTLSPI